MIIPKTDDEIIESLQSQAQELRKLVPKNNKTYYPFYTGSTIIMIEKWPETYDFCPCGSQNKFKFCCKSLASKYL